MSDPQKQQNKAQPIKFCHTEINNFTVNAGTVFILDGNQLLNYILIYCFVFHNKKIFWRLVNSLSPLNLHISGGFSCGF